MTDRQNNNSDDDDDDDGDDEMKDTKQFINRIGLSEVKNSDTKQ